MSEEITNEEQNIEISTNLDHYNVVKTIVESMESDILKLERGNKAAGVRVRKALRLLKGQAGDFVKFTLGK